MPVRNYQVTATVKAVLWTGDESELSGFDDTTCMKVLASGALRLVQDGGSSLAIAHKDYVVQGVTGYYFIVPVEIFEETYTLE